MSIRILICDDHAMVRNGLRGILQTESDFEIVGEAENGRHALSLVERRSPDVVLMDIQMPQMDGLEATKAITQRYTDGSVAVLVLTTFTFDEYVFQALRAGAAGFLLKDVLRESLIEGICSVARGHSIIAPEVTGQLIKEFVASSPNPIRAASLESLTDREREVILLIAAGSTNLQIAKALFLEETTVKTHVSRLLTKLGLTSRVQAVIFAYESGLVTPGTAPGSGLVT